MQKATILFNPNSGPRRRDTELDRAIGIIQSAGVRTDLTVCHSSQEASVHARFAVAAGSDTVFACGGDGTIHDVIQELAGTQVSLAILPFGTANALAHDLGIPLSPSAAARAAVNGSIRRIPLGRIEYQDFNDKTAHRYFTVAAGVGVDAHLFYKLNRDLMKKGGMAAYFLKAWNLWATHRMRRFQAEYANGNGMRQQVELTELLAVRIRFFGNILRELVPGAHLDCPDLRAVMCRTDSRTAYLKYIAAALLGRKWNIDGIDLVSCSEVVCKLPEPTTVDSDGKNKNKNRVYVEADGELLGRLPARMRMQPDALSLVVPAAKN